MFNERTSISLLSQIQRSSREREGERAIEYIYYHWYRVFHIATVRACNRFDWIQWIEVDNLLLIHPRNNENHHSHNHNSSNIETSAHWRKMLRRCVVKYIENRIAHVTRETCLWALNTMTSHFIEWFALRILKAICSSFVCFCERDRPQQIARVDHWPPKSHTSQRHMLWANKKKAIFCRRVHWKSA